MVFSTHLFVFYFLPLVLAVYYVLPLIARILGLSPSTLSFLRNSFLLLASYVFYGWWHPSFVLLMLAITLVNYLPTHFLGRTAAPHAQRQLGVTLAVTVSLGLLGFFKYFHFLQQNLNQFLESVGVDTVPLLQITLPMGISFYTFQAISYSVDVYRRTTPPARSLLDFATYIALFPQLIAGPIVRYHTIAQQLVGRTHSWDKCDRGCPVHSGFFKKGPPRQSTGGGRRHGFWGHDANRRRRMVRRRCLRLADLFRFLRLFRHGGWPGEDDRF